MARNGTDWHRLGRFGTVFTGSQCRRLAPRKWAEKECRGLAPATTQHSSPGRGSVWKLTLRMRSHRWDRRATSRMSKSSTRACRLRWVLSLFTSLPYLATASWLVTMHLLWGFRKKKPGQAPASFYRKRRRHSGRSRGIHLPWSSSNTRLVVRPYVLSNRAAASGSS